MRAATAPLIETLRQLARVVGSLDAQQYAGSVTELPGGSIGAHVRHCCDHVAALLAGAESGTIDYDRRERGTPVETDATAALETLQDLAHRVEGLAAGALERPIAVRALLAADRAPVELPSSLARELAYVISHTTHHNAIIGMLVRAAGGRTPQRFGYAASTLAWMEAKRCAP